jgi:hypothetical protein
MMKTYFPFTQLYGLNLMNRPYLPQLLIPGSFRGYEQVSFFILK